ncbi:MAG: hypothetical protein SOZ89_00400 [Peptoniphilaceae bacterium]|nr:hypothetical protein [Peptoniphilaceae bacterium]MDD7383052.1 hypothetical protein [Peptoniphilaceae bacterium]MDY3737560.1 hypothetical protein [Peptoniphilaceae bacterium]
MEIKKAKKGSFENPYDKDTPKRNLTGFVFDGKNYYFYRDGEITKSFLDIGLNTYYFDENGKMFINCEFIKNDKYYIADKKGHIELFKNSWHIMGNDKYLSDSNGNIVKGYVKVKGELFYFYSDGKMAKNKKFISKGKFFVIDLNGKVKSLKDTWAGIGEDSFYCDKDGNLLKGINIIDDKTYIFSDDYKLIKNDKIIYDDKFYIINANGVASLQKSSWVGKNEKTRLTDDEGKVMEGIVNVKGHSYFFSKENGLLLNTSVIFKDRAYSIGKIGDIKTIKNSRLKIGEKSYYAKEDGFIAKNVSLNIGGIVYDFDENGVKIEE